MFEKGKIEDAVIKAAKSAFDENKFDLTIVRIVGTDLNPHIGKLKPMYRKEGIFVVDLKNKVLERRTESLIEGHEYLTIRQPGNPEVPTAVIIDVTSDVFDRFMRDIGTRRPGI